jgi:enamine deaminase RidA (YjgF/YER057c/UK114 family)
MGAALLVILHQPIRISTSYPRNATALCLVHRPSKEDHAMSKRDAVFPANRHALYDVHRYSAAIRSGDLLFVSGQVGSRADGSPEPAFEDQVRRAFGNLRAVLAAAGCSFDDVVDVTTFHTNPETQIDTVLSVRAQEIGDPPYPNWTAVGVNWLAGFDFEIKVIARIPAGGRDPVATR